MNQLVYQKQVARVRELTKKQRELQDKVDQDTATVNSMQVHIVEGKTKLIEMNIELFELLKELGLVEGMDFQQSLTAFLAEMTRQERE